MELRDIEIFLTLAEELHFGRTAERLYVSPARISQAIKKQEREIGGVLFERTNRAVRLTPIGEQLRSDLVPLYRGLHDSLQRATRAARVEAELQVLRVGVIPSNAHDLRPFWDAFRKRHPNTRVQVRHAPFIDAFGGLRRGDVDILVAWYPIEEPDLTTGPVLYTEPRVLVAAQDHPLAGRSAARWNDLADYGVLTGRGTPNDLNLPDYWEDAFTPFFTPQGRPIERGALMTNLDEMYTVVSAGEHVHSLGAHVARFHARPDIVYIPIDDAEPLRWGVVWRTAAENELIRAFAQVARELGTLEAS